VTSSDGTTTRTMRGEVGDGRAAIAVQVPDDLLAPDATGDPYTVFASLRTHAPVHWSEAHSAWLVTRYADVTAAFQNKALSSDRVRPLLAARQRRGETGPPTAAERVLAVMANWMVVSDPPTHSRLRRLAAGAFKAQRISTLDEQVGELVDGMLDEMLDGWPTDGRTARDLVEHIAYPLPAIVIASLLGVPVEQRDRFREWSDELALVAFGAGGAARAERHERALHSLQEMDAFFRALISERREARRSGRPASDMLTAMMAQDDGDQDRLNDDELVGMCSLLLFAGHETTTNSIANGFLALLDNPDQLARLRADPALIGPGVEELLRFDGPIKVLNRWVLAETEIGGTRLSPGERVHLVVASANHDPERFTDPEVLDLQRSPNAHMAFGKGIHACIGAQLARTETRIALSRIVDRLDGVAPAGPVDWKPSLASRSMTGLPLVREAR